MEPGDSPLRLQRARHSQLSAACRILRLVYSEGEDDHRQAVGDKVAEGAGTTMEEHE